MNPETRTLLKVTIEEGREKEAENRVEHLMGKKPELRFKFIQERSKLRGDDLIQSLDI